MEFGDKGVAFIQWKGTDVCMDFVCECGEQYHFDGLFAYALHCPKCNAIFEMPSLIKAERVESVDYDPRELG